jgi:hypothetical protein
MKTKFLTLTVLTLLLMAACQSESDDFVDDTVTLSESNSLVAKGPPEVSGPIVRGLDEIGFFVLDKDAGPEGLGLTALIGWDTENYWHENEEDFEMEPHMYQWSEISEFYLIGHGELGTLVFEGTPNWPGEECIDCVEFFANAIPVATGTSKFSVQSTINTVGNTFNGQLLTPAPDEDKVMFHAKFKYNFSNGNWIESVSLK